MDEYIKEIEKNLFDDKKFLKVRNNNLMLSDNHVEVLDRYHINWRSCSTIRDIVFLVEEYLNDCDDLEDLEEVSYNLQELSYYSETRK